MSTEKQELENREHARKATHTVPVTSPALDVQIGGDHYKTLKIQPMEYIFANEIPFAEGNAIKYITRHASKGGIEDLNKAIHYLQLIKELRYGN